MINCILHNWLQYQTNNRYLCNGWICFYLKFQLILVAHLLDREVTSDIFNLLSDCYKLILIADTLSEQSRQRSRHYHHFLILLSFSHPDNRIQRIVQEVWIDLRLQGFQFYFSLLLLLLYILLHQFPYPVRHHIKRSGKTSYFIVGNHLYIFNIKISFLHTFHGITKLLDRQRNISGNQAGYQKSNYDQPHCYQHINTSCLSAVS